MTAPDHVPDAGTMVPSPPSAEHIRTFIPRALPYCAPMVAHTDYARLDAERQRLEQERDDAVGRSAEWQRAANEMEQEMRGLLRRIQSYAGHPDPAEGCRLIIAAVREEMGDGD